MHAEAETYSGSMDDYAEHKANSPIDPGHVILDDVHAYLGRFVAYPSIHSQIAHALWIMHTHLMPAWDTTPRIAFLSAEPGSGKSRALEVMEPLVPRPVEAVNVSPAYLFRKVGDEQGTPTILLDEVDTVFGPKARENEELRGLLNAGYRKHSSAGRCVVRGKEVFTEELPAYCAVALAGLGDLPDTILTRSVIVRMRRRAPSEHIEPYRRRTMLPTAENLYARMAAWAELIVDTITDEWPEMPEGIRDRDADVWESLLAVADAAGGKWPEAARVAAVSHVTEAKGSTPSLGVLLLADLRQVFGELTGMSTSEILRSLHEIHDSPWNDLKGKPLDDRGLSRRLKPYGVTRTTIRIGETTVKGYRREDLWDAWERYLSPPPNTSVTKETSETQSPVVTGVTHVTDLQQAKRDHVTHESDNGVVAI